MICLYEAQKLILEATPVLGRESVPILDSLRRVLAQDIVAMEDFPASDISAKDGYAVRHASLRGASRQSPVHLRIIGESAAGRPCGAIVGDGEAVRIMTGGMVPEGADTVVRLELTAEDHGYVICTNDSKPGGDIRFRGESLKKDAVVFRAGTVVSPLEVGALASLRRAYVYVHRKPLVAILTTGDELTDFHEQPSPWKAMSSNLYALAAQVLETGAIPLCLGIVKDDLNAQQSILSEALRADVIITSGGMSMGKYDLIQETFASLGMDMHFSTILGKPGKPSIFGKIGRNLVFGLPGNPSAAMISFEQFITPALLKMMGHLNIAHISNDRLECNGSGPVSLIDGYTRGEADNPGEHWASLIPLRAPFPGNLKKRQKQKKAVGARPGLSVMVAN
ncbi:MAG: gephyrin-like molybdotransferase Glp [Pseudomonadota bacterium]